MMLPSKHITAVILAGGRGSRMGGVDKGLQNFNGMPLAQHALKRISPQVADVMIIANRNLAKYQSLGVPVWSDNARMGEFAGPLAGFRVGLAHCSTPYLLTLPCDTPFFPHDLAARLSGALHEQSADLAIACAPEHGQWRSQPVFCLMGKHLLNSLSAFTDSGGRKVSAWTAQHKVAELRFDWPNDDPHAFFNANSLAELHALGSFAPHT